MLCDDIHIAMKTIGTRYGEMCISSRQTSQGTQRIYTVNTTPLDRVKVTVNVNTRSYDSDSDEEIQRAPASSNSNNIQKSARPCDSDEDIQKSPMSSAARPKPKQRSCAPSSCAQPSLNLTIETDDYEVSNDCMEDSPYLTQTAKTVMRSISYVSSSDSEKSDSEKSDSEKSEAEASEDERDSLTISP
jgi:hypothetical protein